MKSAYSKPSFDRSTNFSRFSRAPVTKWLLIVLIVILVIDVSGRSDSSAGSLISFLSLSEETSFQLWRWFSYPLVSLDLSGWLFSMLVLFSFGKQLEPNLGSRRFASLLGITTLIGAIVYLVMATEDGTSLSGVSGFAISILVSITILYPNQKVQLMIPPISLKIQHIVGGLIVIMVIMAISQRADPAISLAQLSAIGVSFVCMKNKHWLDLGFLSKWGQGISKPAKKKPNRKAPRGMKARTVLNMGESKKEEEINKILDKVSAEGIGNLTEDEREILKFASKK